MKKNVRENKLREHERNIYSGPDMDRDYFNQYTQGYSPYTPADIELLLHDLISEVRSRQINWVCEVGSADGQISLELSKHLTKKISVVGIDIADKVLRLFPFHRLCGDAFNMPFRNNSLDIVCYPATLHHLSPFSLALIELNRVLAPGGLVYFLEPNYFHPQRRFFMSQSSLYHIYRQANDVPVNPDELKTMLINLGIDIIQMRYINIHFKSPGLLQTIQNFLAQINYPMWLKRYTMPWFILIGVKRKINGR